jgi:multidrug efflux pump subunit AcrA (membrane-fusion protein)
MKARVLGVAVLLAVLGALAWGAMRLVKVATATTAAVEVPTTKVRRGTVSISVSARGELQGGNSEMIVVPPLGADSTAITYLRSPGDLVNAGDVVVEFDTTLQDYALREAQADLAEADQQVIQAQATADAGDEENRYSLLSAQSDVKQAELNVRSNPVLPSIKAR